MRLHTRHIPFDFIAPEARKSGNVLLVGLLYLVAVLSLVFVVQWAVAEEMGQSDVALTRAQVAASSPLSGAQIPERSAGSAVLPIALGGAASLLLIGAARRRARQLSL